MAKEIKTEILINATPEKVWSILTNFDNYPNWNPFIKSIKGEVKVGNTITIRIEPPESKGMTFKPKILHFETNKELSWLGLLFFAGLLTAFINLNLLTTEMELQLLDKVKNLKESLCHFSKNNLTTIRKKGLYK